MCLKFISWLLSSDFLFGVLCIFSYYYGFQSLCDGKNVFDSLQLMCISAFFGVFLDYRRNQKKV